MAARTHRLTSSRKRADAAEVGVGTLIIFIAMVLVAAVAAAVIIGTSGSLQQRAQSTGKEATAEVSSNLQVVSIYGERNSTADDIYQMRLLLALSAGSQQIDLSQTIVRFSNGTGATLYRFNGTPAFTLSWIRGDGLNDVADTGDLIELSFNTGAYELAPRSQFELSLLQAVGAPQHLSARTPSTYGSDLHILVK